MALKDRVSKVETHIKHDPQLGPVQWWSNLLADAKGNDVPICGAFYLALNNIIAKPLPGTWKQLEASFSTDPEGWSDSKLAIATGYAEIVCDGPKTSEDYFEDDEGRGIACSIARIFWGVFSQAPLPLVQDEGKGSKTRPRLLCRGELLRGFVVPLLVFACPESKELSHANHIEWLEKMKNVEAKDAATVFYSWRDYIEECKGQ